MLRAVIGGIVGAMLALMLWPAPAAAQWYWGFGVGPTQHHVSVADWDDGADLSGSVKRTDYGFKLIASYQFNPLLTVEGAIVSLGEHQMNGTAAQASPDPGLWRPGQVMAKSSTLGLAGSASWRWPLSPRSGVLLRGGGLLWNTDVTIEDERADSEPRESGGETGVSPLLGLGYDLEIDRATRVQVVWERYFGIGKGALGDYDVDMISASFLVRF